MQRDAFISYSHKRDVPLAQAVESGLHDILRTPWLRRSKLKVFRDTTSLAANHDLDGSIKAALAECRYFIYLASPEAARSRWVREEIGYWSRNHGMEQFLIALSDGNLVWDPDARDFDWAYTDVLPPGLQGAFAAEPLWVDLRGFRDADQRSMKPGSDFRDRVAGLAAPLHGMAKDALDSTDLHIQRKAVRILRYFVVGLLALALTAVVAGVVAWQQRGEALARARTSASQALAARSLALASKDPRKAAQFALYAQAVRPTGESAQAMAQAVAANDSVVRHLQVGHEAVVNYRGAGNVGATEVAISRDGGMLAYYSDFDPGALVGTAPQRIHLYDIAEGRELPHLENASWPQSGGGIEFSADGGTLAVEEPYNRIALWDVTRHKLIRRITASQGGDLATALQHLRAFAFSGDGRRIAASFYASNESEEFRAAVWDVRSGRLISEQTVRPDSLALGFDESNRLLALDYETGRIRSLASGSTTWSGWRVIHGLPRPKVPATARVILSADGSQAFIGERRELWDLSEGRLVSRKGGEGGKPVEGVGALALPGAAGSAVYVADDREVNVYDAELRHPRTLGSFTWPVFSIAVSGDGRWVAAGSQDGAVSLFSTARYQEGVQLPNPPHLKPANLSADHRTAFRTDASGTDVWSVTGRGVRTVGRIPLRGLDHELRGDTLVASLDGTRAVVAQDGVVSLWRPKDGSRLGRHATGDDMFAVLAFLADGVHVVAMSESESAVYVLDTRTWRTVQSIPFDPVAPDTSVAVSADRTTLATVGDDDVLTVWKWAGGKGFQRVRRVSIRPVWTQYGLDVVVSAHGERVAVLNSDGLISTLDVSGGRLVRATSAASDGTALAFSGDSAFLVQAGGSSGLQFWDAATGESRGAWTLPDEATGKGATVTGLLPGDDGAMTTFGSDGSLVRRVVDVAAWQKVLCDLAPQELPADEYDRYLKGLHVSAPCRNG
ncbi:toll/interleukin-1 receptor domain-containing protein [Streptomyces pseudovenezuelae]|uniref:toll/interleukin-1 receptor domain-containing protein n=1 Tax=Streptomyces pseudovenezuelae TaxID=67350 RepID=UPI0036EFA6DF